MQHYVPLHPQVIHAIQPLLVGRSNDEPLFEYTSLLQWVKRAKIPLTRISSHFTLGDLRKFTEQYGDIIGFEQSNRAYIMSHGVSGIDWKHYKHPLPEHGVRELGTGEVDTGEVGVRELGIGELGVGEVGTEEVGTREVSAGKIRRHFRMLFSPRVPRIDH